MKQKNFLKRSFKQAFDQNFDQSMQHTLDESDLNLYSDVVRNLTPSVKIRKNLTQRNQNFNEYYEGKQKKQKSTLANFNKRKKQQSQRYINYQQKNSLSNTYSANNFKKTTQLSSINNLKGEKKLNTQKQFKLTKENSKKKFVYQNNTKDFQQKIVWDCIQKMEEKELQEFMKKLSIYYQQKFHKNKYSTDVDTNDSYFTQIYSPAFHEKKIETSQESELDQIKKELKEVQGLIKKMNKQKTKQNLINLNMYAALFIGKYKNYVQHKNKLNTLNQKLTCFVQFRKFQYNIHILVKFSIFFSLFILKFILLLQSVLCCILKLSREKCMT